MTWRSCHTITARCRTRPLSWRPHQQGQGSRSTERRLSWWRWTQLPTHQSQLVESPYGRWSPLSIWEVWLTIREAQTETPQPELARQEQLLSCSKTSGHLEESAWEQSSASSTPMWSQSCFTDVRHDGQHRRCNERSRHSSTPVWGASTKSNSKREDPKWRSVGASGTGTSGQADTAEEVGLDRTHPQEASVQHHTPSPNLEPAREEEERPALQQLEVRHWSRAETVGNQLVRNDKSSPEQSAMAGGRWWPMLHWERWA